MSTLSVLNPSVGLAARSRFETGQPTMPAQSDAQIVGSRVQEARALLYDAPSSDRLALELTVPTVRDQTMLLPGVFASNFQSAHDILNQARMTDPEGAGPAFEILSELMETRKQCQENLLALNMA